MAKELLEMDGTAVATELLEQIKEWEEARGSA